jgi:hypothetical protein
MSTPSRKPESILVGGKSVPLLPPRSPGRTYREHVEALYPREPPQQERRAALSTPEKLDALAAFEGADVALVLANVIEAAHAQAVLRQRETLASSPYPADQTRARENLAVLEGEKRKIARVGRA